MELKKLTNDQHLQCQIVLCFVKSFTKQDDVPSRGGGGGTPKIWVWVCGTPYLCQDQNMRFSLYPISDQILPRNCFSLPKNLTRASNSQHCKIALLDLATIAEAMVSNCDARFRFVNGRCHFSDT